MLDYFSIFFVNYLCDNFSLKYSGVLGVGLIDGVGKLPENEQLGGQNK